MALCLLHSSADGAFGGLLIRSPTVTSGDSSAIGAFLSLDSISTTVSLSILTRCLFVLPLLKSSADFSRPSSDRCSIPFLPLGPRLSGGPFVLRKSASSPGPSDSTFTLGHKALGCDFSGLMGFRGGSFGLLSAPAGENPAD